MGALLLLTCDRPEYTRRTVESLKRYVDLTQFALYHGDDCSSTDENSKVAADAGFQTVLSTTKRIGVGSMWSKLIKYAHEKNHDWIVLQENDWEWVRKFPFSALSHARLRDDVYCLRLYGVYKEDGKRKCGESHAGKDNKDPQWSSACNGWEVGDIHFGFPPNIIKTSVARYLTSGITSEREARLKSGSVDLLTMRPYQNFVYHFGEERTPEFKP